MGRVCVCLIVFVLSGCENVKEDLVGRWSCTNRPWEIEFTREGRLSMSTIGAPVKGTYRLDAGNEVKIHLDDGRKFKARVAIRGSELTLTDPDGSFSTFRRVPY